MQYSNCHSLTAQQNLNSYFKKKKYLFQAKNCLKQVRLFLPKIFLSV